MLGFVLDALHDVYNSSPIYPQKFSTFPSNNLMTSSKLPVAGGDVALSPGKQKTAVVNLFVDPEFHDAVKLSMAVNGVTSSEQALFLRFVLSFPLEFVVEICSIM